MLYCNVQVRRTVLFFLFIVSGLWLFTGCVGVKVKLQDYRSEPLKEVTLEGKGKEKVLLIPIRGVISSEPKRRVLGAEPSVVREVVSHLKLAAEDPKVKLVILQIDSPGGPVTASDMLYREIEDFKKRTQVKVISMMMGMAASGGYYVALAGDRIIAHPTTVTGSIGVIFVRPSVEGLMEKIGVEVEITKSGRFKDMASPFRDPTDDEKQLLKNIIGEMNERFVTLVAERRRMDLDTARKIADGRICTAQQALKLGLIDEIKYLNEVIREGKTRAGLPQDARLVVYRRSRPYNDNAYNTFTGEEGDGLPQMIDLGLSEYLTAPRTGFYYLWAPEFDR